MASIRTGARRLSQKSPNDVVILAVVRSPVTRAFKGGFKDAYPEDILGPVMAESVRRAKIKTSDINDVLIGNVLAELGFAKTGRMCLNHYGFPKSTTFHTVNRQCSSSLQAITHLSHAIMAGQINVALGRGVESMSRNYGTRGIPVDVSPHLRNSENKDARDCLMPMGFTSENVAERYGIRRKEQDEFALESHKRAFEVVPVTVRAINVETEEETVSEVKRDDGIRGGLTLEKLAALKPIFKPEGGSTVGNSSQMSDGASATILARRLWAEERGLKPIGRFVGTKVAGCAPDEMGISPVFAIPELLKYTGVELSDVDVIELNEAFASQSLYCIQKLGLDMAKVNPNGGAIAIRHPTGATGARQTATLFNELQRSDKEVGIIGMCASTGLGAASLFIRE
ncbi:thiolase [Acephala macrosclerotiorum]|nr:thiolase [Acephala macrosclerotiorum]